MKHLVTVVYVSLMICLGAAQATAAEPAPVTSPQPMKPAIGPAIANPADPTAVRILRNPPSLQLQRMPVTNRLMLPNQVSELIARGQLQIRPPTPSGPPGKRALVIVLENGGIMNNVDPALRQALDVNIRTATCGDWEFQLRNGENIVGLVARVANQLAGNFQCLDPGHWQQTTFNPRQWLNQQTDRALEETVKANNSLVNTQSHYDVVVVMEDANAVPAKVVAAIRSLEPTHVIDVHVLTHGSSESFFGFQGAVFNVASFFGPLKADRDQGKLYLRAVYQMNCISSTLKDDWLALGAVSVNGTQNPTMNNMPQQYFHFMHRWMLGLQGMGTASQGSFEDAAGYTRPIYALVGLGNKVDPSRLTVAGNNVNVNGPR